MDSFAAAKSFGKFSDPFLVEIHGEILSHVNQEAMGHLLQPSHGIVIQDTDVLQPEPIRQGGLVRKDIVRPFRKHPGAHTLMRSKQHMFKQPAKPLEPPTSRPSVLGLDRLAREKRAAAASEDGDRKRQRQDSDNLFKGVGSTNTSFPRSLFLRSDSSSCPTRTSPRAFATTCRGNTFTLWRIDREREDGTRTTPSGPRGGER